MRVLHSFPNSDASGVLAMNTRQGSILVLSVLCMMGLLAAAALSVDVGYLQVTKTRMQNGVDAAALAAAQEITNAVAHAPPDTQDPTAYALASARSTASYVAGLSKIYVDPNVDVTFGQRKYNASSKTWTTTWNASPANTVKVVARRNGDDPSKSDGKLRLFFGGSIGTTFANVKAEAVAYVQARDIAVVHDFSRSMNFDSHFPLAKEANSRLSDTQVVNNMQLLWNDLQPINTGSLKFTPQYLNLTDTTRGVKTTCQFMYDKCYVTTTTDLVSVNLNYTNGSSRSFSVSGENATVTGSSDIASVEVTARRTKGKKTVTQTFVDSDQNVMTQFGLLDSYPFPQGSWSAFISHCRNDEQIIAKGYRESYGGLCFVNYTLRKNSSHSATPKLSTSRHYPFSSIKLGHQLLCNFIKNLSFDDHIGMVSYDTNHRIESVVDEPSNPAIPYVNISSNPMSNDYDAVNNLMKYKQSNYYSPSTNMGGGVGDGIYLLDHYARAGTQPTILLMTDGNSNTMDRGVSTSLPADWDWNKLFDYDGDGAGDYYTSNSQTRYVLLQAYNAVDKGYVIHTIGVGSDADRNLLKAIAWLGGGLFIDVPGGASSAEMETQLLAAFQKIASMVPPAKLLNSEGT